MRKIVVLIVLWAVMLGLWWLRHASDQLALAPEPEPIPPAAKRVREGVMVASDKPVIATAAEPNTAALAPSSDAPGTATPPPEELPAAAPGKEPPELPSETEVIAVDHAGGYLWFRSNKWDQRHETILRWNPANGSALRFLVPWTYRHNPHLGRTIALTPMIGSAYAAFSSGLIAAGPREVQWLTMQNKLLSGSLNVQRELPYLLPLRDGSVLVASGIVGYEGSKEDGKKIFTNAVERIVARADGLTVEPLPELPGEVRRGVALVELADGRVMALGGSSSQYVGSEPMTADTHVLDLATRAWREGPKMTEPRTNATATLLPDGSVLVVGGWAPKHTWQETPTRSTEIWDPHRNRFSLGPLLPLGLAQHQAMWAAGQHGRQLLVLGGMVRAWEGSTSVAALDVATGVWRTVGEGCSGDSGAKGHFMAVPFLYGDRPYVWCDRPVWGVKWALAPLRLPAADQPARVDADKGQALQRWGMAFLPPESHAPGLAVGGSVNGADSAAVDAVWRDGRIQALAPLNHARRNAQVFRLPDGSFLVAGGVGGDPTKRTTYTPPFEWLPSGVPLEKARWQLLEERADDAAYGQLNDGSLLAVKPGGEVERLVLRGGAHGKPVIERSAFPRLNRDRRRYHGEHVERAQLAIRQLPDGRIIVAGGETQLHRIALLQEGALQADAPDQYVGIGDYAPSRHYEVYDPATNTWRESAASRAAGSLAAILDDGRVVKWGRSRDKEALLEISSTDGRTWRTIEGQELPRVVVTRETSAPYPFVIAGELFLSGEHADLRGVDRPAIVQWFNPDKRRWETLWEAVQGENSSLHIGRLIVRQLPNGKRVVLPVAGL